MLPMWETARRRRVLSEMAHEDVVAKLCLALEESLACGFILLLAQSVGHASDCACWGRKLLLLNFNC
jgi:hypothetical protein